MKEITKDGKHYYYFNVDENKLNYSQRDNQYRWSHVDAKVTASTTCNVTSIAMGLNYAGFNFPPGKFDQPEDNLADSILKSELVDKEYARRYPAMYKEYKEGLKDAYTPNEIHKLIEIGTNEWMGRNVDTFHEDYPIASIISQIVNKCSPVVASGRFPKANGGVLNHIICIVGIAFSDEEYNNHKDDLTAATPSYWIVDDPWGYTGKYEESTDGNDVFISNENFIAWFKPVNNTSVKYAHVFEKPVATV